MNTTPTQLNIDFNAVLELAKELISYANSYNITSSDLRYFVELDDCNMDHLSESEIELALTIAAGRASLSERSSEQQAMALQGINRLQNDIIKEVN